MIPPSDATEPFSGPPAGRGYEEELSLENAEGASQRAEEEHRESSGPMHVFKQPVWRF